MSVDPLASWWVHDLDVERYLGPGEAGGKSYAAAETVTGFYDDKTQYSGGEITASGRFAFPSAIAYVPVESRVTLPAKFGGRVCEVKASAVGDGGGQPTPDHQMIEIL